jgi:hypothetical protein
MPEEHPTIQAARIEGAAKVKAAKIGFIGLLVVAALGILFRGSLVEAPAGGSPVSPTPASNAASISGDGNITIQGSSNVTIIQGVPVTPSEARQQARGRIDPDSPDLQDLRIFKLVDLKAPVLLKAGNCPNSPCMWLLVEKPDFSTDPPSVFVGLNTPDTSNVIVGTHLGSQVPLKKLCGITFRTRQLDTLFEIRDDSPSSLRVWVALRKGSEPDKGLGIEHGCL